MRRYRKLFIVLASVLGLGLLAAVWAKHSPWLSARLKDPIQSALAQASGRPVALGGVGGGLSGWIWLQDVALGADPAGKAVDLSVTAKAVGLRFDLSDLVRGRTDLSHLRALRVEDPRVYLLRRGQSAALSAPAASGADWREALKGLGLAPLRLDLRDGEAYADEGGQPLRRLVRDLRVGLEPDPKGWRLRGQALLETGGRLALWGQSPEDFSRYQLKARASAIQVGPWQRWLDLPAGLTLNGLVDGQMDLDGEGTAAPALSGQGELHDVSAAWRGQSALEGLAARWTWDGRALALDRVDGRSQGGRLEGSLAWSAAEGARGRLKVNKAELASIVSLLGAPRGLSLSGRADLELSATPGLSTTAWTLSARAPQAAWAGHPLQRFELRGQGSGLSGSAGADLGWEGGSGRADLVFDAVGLESATLKAEALPAAWAGAASGLDLSGPLGVQARYRRLQGQSPWELSAQGERLKAGGLELQSLRLSAGGSAQQMQARVEADLPRWKGLNAVAEAVAVGENWELKRLRLFEKERLRLDAGGRTTKDGADLTLRSAELPLEALRTWLPASLQGLSGSVQAKGELHWRGKQASGRLDLDAPLLQAAGYYLPGSARLSFAPGAISVTALDLRHGELSGSAGAPAWEGPWSAALRLKGAQSGPWLALAGAPGALSGTASGSLTHGADGALSAELELSEPLPAELPKAGAALRLRSKGSAWHLEKLELKQGQGSLSASGKADLASAAGWEGRARWQGLRWRGSAIEGEASMAPGDPGVRLALGPWSLSGTALPRVDASWRVQEGGLKDLAAAVGEHTRVRFLREGAGWRARAELAGQDLVALVGPWLGRAGSGSLALSGWAELRLGGNAGARWRADLSDDGVSGSRLQAESGAESGLASAQWAQIDLERWAKALSAAGLLELPSLAGRSSGQGLSGPQGLSVSAKATGFKALGADFGPAELRGSGRDGHWTLERFSAGGTGPQLRLTQWHLRTEGSGWGADGAFALDQLPVAIFDLAGEGQAKLQGKGAQAGAELRFKPLQVSERRYPELGLKAQWDAGRLSLAEASKKPAFKAELRFKDGAFYVDDVQAVVGAGKASLKGAVEKDESLHFEGTAQGFPAGELTGWMGWTQDWQGAAYGNLVLNGKLGAVRGVISAKIENGSVSGLPFDLATGLVHLEPEWVQLSPLRPIRMSRSNGVSLEVSGQVPLDDDKGQPAGPLSVDAVLKDGGLGLLAGLPAIQSASGPLELSLHFSGRTDDPSVSGRMRVSEGKITPAWLVPPLEHVELYAQLDNGQFILQKAEGQVVGGGPLLKVENASEKRPAFVFERWEPADFNLRLRASKSGLPLRNTAALKFIEGQAHPDLRLSGNWASPLLEGEVLLEKGGQDKALVLWPPQFGPEAKHAPPPVSAEGSFLDKVRYDLRLLARQDVMVRTEAAQVFVDSGTQGLRLSGSGPDRELEGHLQFTRGSVDYLLASFELAQDKETYVGFRPGAPPELELWGFKRLRDALLAGETVGRDVELRLHAYGPLGQVQMRLESDDSGLSQQQLASLAGFGVDASDPRSQGGFARLLGKVPGTFLTSLGRRTGVIDEVGVRLPAVEEALAGPRETPGAIEGQPAPLSSNSRTLVEINAGKYWNEKLYFGVKGLVNEQREPDQQSSEVKSAVGGKVEYQMKNRTRVSAQQNVDSGGQAEQRVMLERNSSFANYNPRKRRWDLTPTPGPGSSAKPKPSPSPSPTPEP